MHGCLVRSFLDRCVHPPGAPVTGWRRLDTSDWGVLSSGSREIFRLLLGIKELEILEAACDLRISVISSSSLQQIMTVTRVCFLHVNLDAILC